MNIGEMDEEEIDDDFVHVSCEGLTLTEDSNLCVICMDKKVSILVLPCAHLCMCPECAGCMTHCPLCRKTFKGYVRVFLTS